MRRGSTDTQTQTQQQAHEHDEKSIRTDRLFRHLRRLDHRKPLTLALRFEILRNLRLRLFGENLPVFELRGLEFARHGVEFSLHFRRFRHAALIVVEFRLQLIAPLD